MQCGVGVVADVLHTHPCHQLIVELCESPPTICAIHDVQLAKLEGIVLRYPLTSNFTKRIPSEFLV